MTSTYYNKLLESVQTVQKGPSLNTDMVRSIHQGVRKIKDDLPRNFSPDKPPKGPIPTSKMESKLATKRKKLKAKHIQKKLKDLKYKIPLATYEPHEREGLAKARKQAANEATDIVKSTDPNILDKANQAADKLKNINKKFIPGSTKKKLKGMNVPGMGPLKLGQLAKFQKSKTGQAASKWALGKVGVDKSSAEKIARLAKKGAQSLD